MARAVAAYILYVFYLKNHVFFGTRFDRSIVARNRLTPHAAVLNDDAPVPQTAEHVVGIIKD
jgi:hypothetical protein